MEFLFHKSSTQQIKYATEVLKKFAMKDYQLIDNPAEHGIKLTKERE
jgi:hypothetical protein